MLNTVIFIVNVEENYVLKFDEHGNGTVLRTIGDDQREFGMLRFLCKCDESATYRLVWNQLESKAMLECVTVIGRESRVIRL